MYLSARTILNVKSDHWFLQSRNDGSKVKWQIVCNSNWDDAIIKCWKLGLGHTQFGSKHRILPNLNIYSLLTHQRPTGITVLLNFFPYSKQKRTSWKSSFHLVLESSSGWLRPSSKLPDFLTSTYLLCNACLVWILNASGYNYPWCFFPSIP